MTTALDSCWHQRYTGLCDYKRPPFSFGNNENRLEDNGRQVGLLQNADRGFNGRRTRVSSVDGKAFNFRKNQLASGFWKSSSLAIKANF